MLIKVTIDRFEGDTAVLKTEDAQSIVWPKDKLPKNVQEGSVLKIAIGSDIAAESADKELAKDILNEILDSSQKE